MKLMMINFNEIITDKQKNLITTPQAFFVFS